MAGPKHSDGSTSGCNTGGSTTFSRSGDCRFPIGSHFWCACCPVPPKFWLCILLSTSGFLVQECWRYEGYLWLLYEWHAAFHPRSVWEPCKLIGLLDSRGCGHLIWGMTAKRDFVLTSLFLRSYIIFLSLQKTWSAFCFNSVGLLIQRVLASTYIVGYLQKYF